MVRQYTGQPYMGWDSIWHYPYTESDTGQSGEDLSYEGPQQPSYSSPSGGAGNPVQQYPFLGYNQWGGTVAPSTPATIGAGTAGIQYGYGVPGFGQAQIPIQQSYLDYLQSAPGYIPGSGTYNQFNLSQPGLLTTILGQQVNARYGQGGTGDPTTGQEVQTPQEWINGDPLFTWQGNMGQTADTQGLDYIANLFGRGDTPSGIGTAAWSAPDVYWQGLYQAIAQGKVQPTARGWHFLQSVKGQSPQSIGGVAPQQFAAVGGAAAGGADTSMQGALASIAASQAADQAARLAYQEWVMRTGDETLAQQKAQQAWQQAFQEKQQAWTQAYQTAGLTGQYQGQQTQAAQQQAWAQQFAQQQLGQQGALGLLQLQSALQGPRDWAKYWQLSASAPEGLKSALGALAGQYNFAPGAQGTPGPATLQSRTADLLAPGAGGQGTSQAGGTGQQGQAANPWQFDLQNWSRMNPSMQQGVLGGLEAGGMYGPDVEALLRAAAPRYTFGSGQTQVGMG